MFTADDIHTRIRQQPFMPMRVVTSAGESYDIYHPDLVMVGRRYLLVGTASSENPKTFDTESRVSIMHITAIENLPAPSSPEGNGRK